MKKTSDADNKKLYAMLENLELPEVQMPAHQRRLRENLLASGCLETEGAIFSGHAKFSAWINKMKPKTWKLAASLAVVLIAVGVYMTSLPAPRAVASLTLQVNPALTLTLSGRNTVIDAEGLDAQGEALLARLDVAGKEMQKALRTISGALHEAGLLGPERRMVVALYAIVEGVPLQERLTVPKMYALTENVRQALLGYTVEQGLPVEVKVYEITAELAAAAHAADLLPADYADFMIAAGYPLAKELLNLQKELGIDPALFKEELDTIEAAMLDLREAGIEAQPDILAVFRRAFAADPKLEELTAITAAMIDLVEEGLSKEEALVRIQAAIKADPSLQRFDELLEVPGKEKEEADEAAEADRPKPDKPEKDKPEPPDNPEADKPRPGEPQPDKPKSDKPEADEPEADVPGEGADGAEPGEPQPGRPQIPDGVPSHEADEE
ncbi:MAG: hypothetical protein DDT21_00566 [Syntrophomonadaceae bacterium]|nr:hypothetical protein [Bacillota bacterium]